MILDEILTHKRQEVALRRALRPLALPFVDTPAGPGAAGPEAHSVARIHVGDPNAPDIPVPYGRRFLSELRQPGVSVIAEIKRRSPSGGALRPDLAADDLARMYADGGAAALSVLTDERYFGGSDADLVSARQASGLPALRKDFVVDPYQILEASTLGADAILLIVRALSDAELVEFLELAQRCGLDALVETHSESEVERALAAGARIIGVNNRDLDTLITDVSLAPRLRPRVPSTCVFVAESGISRPEDVAVLVDAGVDAVLVGESLLRAPDPGAKLATLVAAGRAQRVR